MTNYIIKLMNKMFIGTPLVYILTSLGIFETWFFAVFDVSPLKTNISSDFIFLINVFSNVEFIIASARFYSQFTLTGS